MKFHRTFLYEWGNGGRYRMIGYALAVSAGVLVGVVGFAWLHQPPAVYDPLGEYPTQIVTSRVEGVSSPAARLGGTVDVTGTKCNNSDEPVQVNTTQVWTLSVPAGTQIERPTDGTSTRIPGCTTSEFQNVIPAAVVERTEQLLFQGIRPVWRITGCDTPIHPYTGEDGERRCYETQNFTLLSAAEPEL